MSDEQVKIPEAILRAEHAHAKTCKGKNISDNELADNMRKLCATLLDVVDGWQEKCTRSEQALAALEAQQKQMVSLLLQTWSHATGIQEIPEGGVDFDTIPELVAALEARIFG